MRNFISTFSMLLVLTAPAAADIYVINPEGTGDFPTIQAAVIAAVDGDIIELTDGTFIGEGNRNVIYIGKAITIRSQTGNPDDCIIDCQNAGRAFDFYAGEGPGSILEGVTVTNGNRDPGAGVRCWLNACPTIRNCIFANNASNMIGGAICCVGHSSPTLTNCTFIGNFAECFGGAVIAWVDAEPTITECTFIENSAAFGGAIECADRALVTVQSCTFWRNTASQRGGAIISEESSHVTLTQCTLYENAADESGAGLCCEVDGHAYLDNTIIAFSTSSEAIYCSPSSSAALACCDLYGNAGGDWVGSIADQYGINGNICEDPLFCEPEHGNFRLMDISPCAPFSPPNPECDLIGAWPVGCGQGINRHEALPIHLYLAPGSPNPFGQVTEITYRIPGHVGPSAPVVLGILDATGRRIRTLVDGRQSTGTYSVTWDGTCQPGNLAAVGLYFCRLTVGNESVTRRLLLVR